MNRIKWKCACKVCIFHFPPTFSIFQDSELLNSLCVDDLTCGNLCFFRFTVRSFNQVTMSSHSSTSLWLQFGWAHPLTLSRSVQRDKNHILFAHHFLAPTCYFTFFGFRVPVCLKPVNKHKLARLSLTNNLNITLCGYSGTQRSLFHPCNKNGNQWSNSQLGQDNCLL